MTVFLKAAKHVAKTGEYSCFALNEVNCSHYDKIRYVDMFNHGYLCKHGWWNGRTGSDYNHEARIYALLLTHEMYLSGDL